MPNWKHKIGDFVTPVVMADYDHATKMVVTTLQNGRLHPATDDGFRNRGVVGGPETKPMTPTPTPETAPTKEELAEFAFIERAASEILQLVTLTLPEWKACFACDLRKLIAEAVAKETAELRNALETLYVPYSDSKAAHHGGLPSGVYVQRFRFEVAAAALSRTPPPADQPK